MLIHLTNLESILSKEKIDEIKKEVTFKLMQNQENLALDIKPEHIKPDRMHFSAMVRIFPKELKKRKPRASRKETEQQIFSDFKEFRL